MNKGELVSAIAERTDVSKADVERVLKRDFSSDDVTAALALLADYGKETWHREVPRVRLAILKLAGGNLQKLREAIKTASNDYRDVLAYAEYPSYFQKIAPNEPDAAKRNQAIDSDWREYRGWFERT